MPINKLGIYKHGIIKFAFSNINHFHSIHISTYFDAVGVTSSNPSATVSTIWKPAFLAANHVKSAMEFCRKSGFLLAEWPKYQTNSMENCILQETK